MTQSHSLLDVFSFESSVLKDNRLKDPFVRDVAVILPPEYYADTAQQYPVIYLLPSHGRTNHYYVGWNQYEERIQERLYRLMTTAVMPPVITVMPDCWTRFGGSQYLDSAIGRYESYLIQEIIPEIDRRYRTLSSAEHRAVAGHSSGGYGALTLAMKHPDIFGAVASRAPDMYWEYTVLPALAQFPLQLEKWGGYEQFIDTIPSIHPKKGDFWLAIHTMMQCMAYAPNPDATLGFDSPIDLDTGALIPEVWERWLTHDPVRMLDNEDYQASLRGMKAIYIDVGKFDSYLLQIGARIFHRKLDQLEILHQYEEFADGHGSTSYRYDISLPVIANAISK